LLHDRIIAALPQAAELYHRLVLVVGPPGSGKTTALHAAAAVTGCPVLNVSLELSRALLELTERQRILRASQELRQIIQATGAPGALLDNLELLFETSLKQDPLRCLQTVARSMTIVAAWSGRVEDAVLTYAVPGHPEYRRYPARDLLIVTPGD
jgi:hypothetical protein